MGIREICRQDAKNYLSLLNQLDRETKLMLYELGERKSTEEEVAHRLEKVIAAEHETIFVAEEDGELVGHIEGHGGSLKRNRHTVCVVIGIIQTYHNRGIGTKLFEALEDWAEKREIHRMELTVMEHNRPAMMLYAKRGFQVEGMRKQALYVDERFVNEFYMAKIFG